MVTSRLAGEAPARRALLVGIGLAAKLGTSAVGAISGTVIARTPVIDRPAAVIDRAAIAVIIVIIGAPVLGGRDGQTGADNPGKRRRCRRTAAAAMMIDPGAGAEVGGPAGRATDPALAAEGSTTASAIAATVAITVARPIDENTAFRANISKFLHGRAARQAACNQPLKPMLGSRNRTGAERSVAESWRSSAVQIPSGTVYAPATLQPSSSGHRIRVRCSPNSK